MSYVVSDQWIYKRPGTLLGLCFVIWKLTLLAVAWTSPYPGYDTSSSLLFPPGIHDSEKSESFHRILHSLAGKVIRWDAVYFAQIAHRGALYEQEWAFYGGYTKLLNFLTLSV